MEVVVTDFSLRLVQVHLSFGASVGELTRFFSREQGIPYSDFYVTSNGRLLAEDEELRMGGWYRLVPRLCGGKGGFGSMLRALGAQIEKTTNREACRDLSGRRLRDVNHEKEMAEWLKKQADREAEKEQRRLERLQRKLAEPKHYFSDPDYEKQCRDMTERMEESIKKGLQASSSGTSGASRKRPSAYGADPGKRPRLWQSGLDGVSSSDDDSEGSDEEPSPSSSSSSSSSSSTSQKNSLALLPPKPTKAHSSCGSSSSSPREIPEAMEAGPVTPEVEKKAKRQAEPMMKEVVPEGQREAEPLTQEVGPGAQQEAEPETQEAEPEARRDTEPVSQEAGPETQQEAPSVTQEVGPEAQKGAEVEMGAFQREAKPVTQEAEPETQQEAQSVTQEVGPEAERGAEVDKEAESSAGLQEELQIRSSPENHTQPESRAESTATQPADDAPLDLQTVGGAVELEALGMERLKGELIRLGLKCGGTLQERAARLFSIRGLSRDQIPPALLAKPTKPRRK